MSDPLEEHRRFPRIPSQNSVLVRRPEPQLLEGFARTNMVGRGGCGFVSDEALGRDAVLELLISVGSDVVRANARVAYERPLDDGRFEIGVEFLDLSEDDRAVIDAICSGSTTASSH